ncbi:MAG: ysnF [Frankiales bacterium]|nr:ysnF [Frankiales bacterium]
MSRSEPDGATEAMPTAGRPAGPGTPAGREDGDARTHDLTLSQERLQTGTETVETGRVRARKTVQTERVEQTVPRGVEHADIDRVSVLEGDSGEIETLPDGSLSIPVFEEQIVVEKRLVVRERVILRKHTVYEDHLVQADLRRERLDVDVEGDVTVTGDRTG